MGVQTGPAIEAVVVRHAGALDKVVCNLSKEVQVEVQAELPVVALDGPGKGLTPAEGAEAEPVVDSSGPDGASLSGATAAWPSKAASAAGPLCRPLQSSVPPG